MPQIKPDYREILYASSKPKDDLDWKERMHGLMRYRTSFLASDVIALIQAMDVARDNTFCRVFFENTPTPLEEEGIRYNFYIEYGAFGSQKHYSPKKWEKTGQIDGVVISEIGYTIIEYRSTFSQENPLIAMLSPGWLFLVLCSIAATLQSLTFWIKDGPGLSFLMNLTCGIVFVLMIIPVLAFMGMGLRRNEFMLMDDVVRKLGAIKLEDAKAKKKEPFDDL